MAGDAIESSLDLDRVRARVEATLDGAPVASIEPLVGGASSLTFAATLAGAGDRVVVKVAPPGLPPVRNRDVLRQARVLQALADDPGVAVPTVLGTDAGTSPDDPPLFVMSFVAGSSVEPYYDAPDPATSSDDVAARASALLQMLVAMQAVQTGPIAAEPITTLSDELGRWERSFESVEGSFVPRARECGAALRASMPEPGPPVLVHGDFRIGNALARGREILAIIDWEVWGVGDGRLDLAWFVNFCDASHPMATEAGTGMPSPADALAEYERLAGTSVADVDWFVAMVRYRQAAMCALVAKHASRSSTPNPRAAQSAAWIEPLLGVVLERI